MTIGVSIVHFGIKVSKLVKMIVTIYRVQAYQVPIVNQRWPPRNLVSLTFQHQTAVISRASSRSPCFNLFQFYFKNELSNWKTFCDARFIFSISSKQHHAYQIIILIIPVLIKQSPGNDSIMLKTPLQNVRGMEEKTSLALSVKKKIVNM